MALVLVKGVIFQCSHAGQTKLSDGSAKLTVNNSGVITSGMEQGISFGPGPDNLSPCTNTTTSSPPVLAPCQITAPAGVGVASKLTVGGVGVLLDSANGLTTNTQGAPPGTWKIANAGQTLLTAV